VKGDLDEVKSVMVQNIEKVRISLVAVVILVVAAVIQNDEDKQVCIAL
jgi:hypothetical protein